MLILVVVMMLMRNMMNVFSHENGEKPMLMIQIILIIMRANRVMATLMTFKTLREVIP